MPTRLALTTCFVLMMSFLSYDSNAQTVRIGDELLDIQYSAGTGSNTSYFVVDFGGSPDSVPGPKLSYAFAYQWDNEATSADALIDLSNVANGLTLETTEFSFGLAIDRLSFGQDDDTPDFNEDDRFWNFYQGTLANDLSWAFSGVGISDRALTDGSFDGFRAQPFDANSPGPQLPAVAIPEPNSQLLFLLGTLICFSTRRRPLLKN